MDRGMDKKIEFLGQKVLLYRLYCGYAAQQGEHILYLGKKWFFLKFTSGFDNDSSFSFIGEALKLTVILIPWKFFL